MPTEWNLGVTVLLETPPLAPAPQDVSQASPILDHHRTETAAPSRHAPGRTAPARPAPPRTAPPRDLALVLLEYQDRLYATIYRIVNHPDDTADLVQETYARALAHLPNFEGRSSLYTWLFRIGVNLALSHRRSLRYRGAVSLDDTPPGDASRRPMRQQLAQRTETDPVDAVIARLDHQRVLAALNHIDPASRALIVLRDLEDCDYDQIAQIMNVPAGTIKSRLFRARNTLRSAATRQTARDAARRRVRRSA